MPKRLGSAADPLWYKDAIVYEVHVRAFKDSNGDGIGDFPGLIQKMDYLQDLGVTCLWLLPFFPSPLKDDGYDISDYLNVHPMYGTIEDFRTFLAAAHDRGMQVMIELVVNHTSDQHPVVSKQPDRLLATRRNETSTSGATLKRNTNRHESFSPTPNGLIGPGTRLPSNIIGTVFSLTSRISTMTIPECSKKLSRSCVIGWTWESTRCAWTLSLILVERDGNELRKSSGNACHYQGSSDRRLMRTIPTACFWRKPINGRPTCVRISAMATNATWRSIFR